MNSLRSVCWWILMGLVWGGILSRVQGELPSETLARAAEEKYSTGDIQGAISLYEELIGKYPSYDQIWGSRFNLAVAYFQVEEFDKSIAKLDEVGAEKNPDRSLREQARLLLPAAHAARANLARSESARKEGFAESVRLYDLFLKDFPKSKSRAEVLHGKAVAQLQAEKLVEAERTLIEFSRLSEVKPSLRSEATYLMARVKSAQARKLREENKETEASEALMEAKKFFDQVLQHSKDTGLTNEALLSAGDMFFRVKQYGEAVRYLRKVRPKKFSQEEQEKVVQQLTDLLKKAKAEVGRTGDRSRVDEIGKELERARKRLKSLEGKASLWANAQELISQCLFEQKKYDEVLVLNRKILPELSPDQTKRANYLIMKVYLAKKKVDKVVERYQEFKSLHPHDTLTQDICLGIADAYLKQKKPHQAMKWADEYESAFPDGSLLEQALYVGSAAATLAGDVEQAEVRNKKFREKFPGSSLAGAALYNKAYTSYQKKDYAAAIQDFSKYLAQFPEAENADAVAFLIAGSQLELKKFDEAIQAYQDFEKRFPKSKQVASSLYQLGKAYEGKRDVVKANESYQRVVQEFSEDEIAPYAQFGIALNLMPEAAKHLSESLLAFDQLISRYPHHKLAAAGLFYKAEIYRNARKYEEAVSVYREVVEKCPESDSAAESYAALGDLAYQEATRMAGKPEKLSPEKQAAWKKDVAEAQGHYESILHKFSGTSAVDKALSQLSLLWQARIQAGFATQEEAKSYFEGLRAETSGEAYRTKILFTLGGLLSVLKNGEAALEILSKAYLAAGQVSLPNEGYSQYRLLLMEHEKYDKAIEVSNRQIQEKRDQRDERGVAQALLGRGEALFKKGDWNEASEDFSTVASKYAWYPQVAHEAELYRLWCLEKEKKFDDAIQGYQILASQVSPQEPETRVKIYLRQGHAWYGKSQASTTEKKENLKEALGYFLRVGTTFGAFPSYASEGLYMAAQISELGVVVKGDGKDQQVFAKKDAIQFYQRCVQLFPSSSWAVKSKERLQELGP